MCSLVRIAPDKRTQAEQAVVERYLKELYPEGMSNVESGMSNAGAQEGSGAPEGMPNGAEPSGPNAHSVELVPVGRGAFGDVYDQFRGNAQGAIAFLEAKQGGEAVGALHHKDVGDIDLVWGKAGTGKSDGYGLAKLVKFHPEVNIVLNKSKKKKKEVVTKAENNYLSSECPSSTTSYGKISIIRANNLASAQRKNQVHHKKIGGR